jgi:hypothetical protein
MGNKIETLEESLHRRSLGVHLTSSDIFMKFIFPVIKKKLWEYKWIDLYAGEGNLILPILKSIHSEDRIRFFRNHIYLSDIQEEMIEKCIKKAEFYGIPSEIASSNVILRDNLESFPDFLRDNQKPIFHITNPPYLYLGYIRKHKETQKYLKFFEGKNKGYQDLYQIALINDLRNEIDNLTYIIPSNFLFGASVSNKFRLDFLKYYKILKIIVFETKIFEFTGTNICIGFFKRKAHPSTEILNFSGIKIKKQGLRLKRKYILKPKYKFRAGSEFNEFIENYKVKNQLKVHFYLTRREALDNKGDYDVEAIDANQYINGKYKKIMLKVNSSLKDEIEHNILYVKTVDTGSNDGRVGLGIIKDEFNVQAIFVSSNTYRTHPIQIFIKPQCNKKDQLLLKKYFNFILEFFRENLDSEFLTTYKYSNAEYTRKYLGLTQVRDIIKTFPLVEGDETIKQKIDFLIDKKDLEELFKLIKIFS